MGRSVAGRGVGSQAGGRIADCGDPTSHWVRTVSVKTIRIQKPTALYGRCGARGRRRTRSRPMIPALFRYVCRSV